jgi:predicted phosphodiesterase
MKIAALHDIHGNIWALEAVMKEIRAARADAVVIGGDVAYGPAPAEIISLLRSIEAQPFFVKGNADRDIVEAWDGVEPSLDTAAHILQTLAWCAQKLRRDDRDFLAAFSPAVSISSPPLGDILFVHATPDSDEAVFTEITPSERISHRFASVQARTVVCGHTHLQFERRIGGIRVVNSGSVGRPYGESGAFWLMIDQDVEFRRTVYDLESAAKAMRATEFPLAEQWASDLIAPPPRDEVIAFHERRVK